MTKPRSYSQEFKREAVALTRQPGVSWRRSSTSVVRGLRDPVLAAQLADAYASIRRLQDLDDPRLGESRLPHQEPPDCKIPESSTS